MARGANEAWHRFRRDAAALPRAAWVRWLRTLLIGFLATTGLALALVWAGKQLVGLGMQAWDRALLLEISRRDWLSFQQAIWVETWGSSAFLLPVMSFAALVALFAHRPMRAASIVAAYALHDPIVLTAWKFWDRARPDLIAGGIAAPALHSYPSGHMVNVVATFGFFVVLWMRSSRSRIEQAFALLLLTALSAAVGYARLRMGTHWPSDIIAGTLIGVAWLATVAAALDRAENARA